MGLKSAKTLFNKPSSQRWDTSDPKQLINRRGLRTARALQTKGKFALQHGVCLWIATLRFEEPRTVLHTYLAFSPQKNAQAGPPLPPSWKRRSLNPGTAPVHRLCGHGGRW